MTDALSPIPPDASSQLLTVGQAATHVSARFGRPVSAITVWRWMRKGVGPGGELKLGGLRGPGGCLRTTVADLDCFCRAWAALGVKPRASAREEKRRPRTERQRARDIERAEKFCEKHRV